MPTRKDDPTADQTDAQRPIDPILLGDDDPPILRIRINQVSPIAGALAGGIDVTLTGTGFQPEAEVYFGSTPSPEVTFVSPSVVRAKLPPASQTGSVNVSLFNSDGTGATRPGGFTYVVTGTGAQAEVMGVAPLSVIEDTESEITLRGRNLIEAYTNGMLALRGPTRANVTVVNVLNSRDETTGIEELTFSVRITATPQLDPLERMAIQVLASSRPGAQNDGVVESSRHMFTVLPRSRPVPLAYSANLDPGKPNLVVVAGRNLEGCTLDLGDGATVHLQRSDDRILAGIVTFGGRKKGSGEVPSQLAVRAADGTEVAQYGVLVAADSGEAMLAEGDALGTFSLTLTPVPDQQIIGPTEQDSAVFNLRGESAASSLIFDWGNFEITILDITIVLPIVNEVHLIPFFDGGGDDLNDLPVLAEVGKLLRLRGVGILVALRVEIIIHIRVVLIIGFIFEIWPFGLFNEFPEYGWSIGSIVIGIRIEIQIIFIFAFLLALVLPEGRLRVLLAFNLTVNLDILINEDNGEVHFGASYRVRYNRIGPLANTLLPCDGRFQLASENGQTIFTDAFGGQQSFYFPREVGECCVPWNYELQLVRFAPGTEEIVQSNFRADYCLNAAPSARLGQIIITSEHPSPTGVPPRLMLDIGQPSAALIALSLPVDANGVPTGEPAQDVRDLGYDVEFYLGLPTEIVLDPTSLPFGDAFAIQPGDNVIHALLTPRQDQPQLFAFWPDGVLGFVISRFLAEGRAPGIQSGALPVTVNAVAGTITVTPTLAYRNERGEIVPTDIMDRFEPFEPPGAPPRYFLAAKINVPTDVPVKTSSGTVVALTFKVVGAQLSHAPLAVPNVTFAGKRGSVSDPPRFFAGTLAQANQQVSFKLSRRPDPNQWVEIAGLNLEPNRAEDAALTKLVPPGKLVGNADVRLSVSLEVTSSSSARVLVTRPQLPLTVRHDETFEEYLRVLKEVATLMVGADATLTELRDFAKTFFHDLQPPITSPPTAPAAPTAAKLKEKGERLWTLGTTLVQKVTEDDRPLYWARLQTIAALRAFYRRNNLSGIDQAVINLEWPSRGLEQASGRILFPAMAANARKAIVTGFDPFALPDTPNRSNPSGLAALALNGDDKLGSARSPAFVRTAVFPVRYRDFDAGLVEKAVQPNLNSIVLLLTCSDNFNREFYDVERFAGKRRGGFRENENATRLALSIPPLPTLSGTSQAEEFYESTLPYADVITSASETLSGPKGAIPFVLDQGFEIQNADTTDPKQFHPSPESGDQDKTHWFTKTNDQPLAGRPLVEGSGGSYLSNEIFYRTARARAHTRPSLKSGHLHVPSTGTTPAGERGQRLIEGVRKALREFLEHSFRMTGSGDLNFPRTPVGRTSQPLTLTVTNVSGSTLTVGAVEVAAPFAIRLPGPLPIAVGAGVSLALPIIFAPTDQIAYSGTVTLRDENGDLLLTAGLAGEGGPPSPAPSITTFSPTSGRPGISVIIDGENFDGATDVRIGSGSVPFMVNSNTRITADVTEDATTGPIAVDTPSGTATSATAFRLIFIGPPREEIGTQLARRRSELDLEPSDAAQQIGVRTRTYTRWERRQDEPSARFRPAIARFLGYDPEPPPQTLGERIRAARLRSGLSQPQLAERLNVSASTVRAWEAGRVSRPTPRVRGIFEAFVNEG
jgi:transcriptional regulator with XRE-family HTH domain/pyrrolidone-carboxylate peptidase